MAQQNYGVDWLLSQTYRIESIATSSQTFDEEDVIEFLNMELQDTITPIIQSVNEEYGVMQKIIPIVDGVIPDIRIPSQATGSRLRQVQLVSSQGYISNVPRLDPDRLGLAGWNGVAGFYLQNNELIWYPRPPTAVNGILRITYFRRANTLVPSNQTGRVIAVDANTGIMTLDRAPIGDEWTAGTEVDVIIGQTPFDFRVEAAVTTDVSGQDIQIDPALAALVVVGDYVALSGFSPVAQFIPLEATYLLARCAARDCLQALGDTEGVKLADAKIERDTQRLLNLVSDRIEGQPKRLVAIGMERMVGANSYFSGTGGSVY